MTVILENIHYFQLHIAGCGLTDNVKHRCLSIKSHSTEDLLKFLSDSSTLKIIVCIFFVTIRNFCGLFLYCMASQKQFVF
jgi:hypothetical protein